MRPATHPPHPAGSDTAFARALHTPQEIGLTAHRMRVGGRRPERRTRRKAMERDSERGRQTRETRQMWWRETDGRASGHILPSGEGFVDSHFSAPRVAQTRLTAFAESRPDIGTPLTSSSAGKCRKKKVGQRQPPTLPAHGAGQSAHSAPGTNRRAKLLTGSTGGCVPSCWPTCFLAVSLQSLYP